MDFSFEFSEFLNIDVSFSSEDIQLLEDRIKKLVNGNRNGNISRTIGSKTCKAKKDISIFAYFFTGKSTWKMFKKKVIIEIMVFVSYDMAGTNQAMWKDFGVGKVRGDREAEFVNSIQHLNDHSRRLIFSYALFNYAVIVLSD